MRSQRAVGVGVDEHAVDEDAGFVAVEGVGEVGPEVCGGVDDGGVGVGVVVGGVRATPVADCPVDVVVALVEAYVRAFSTTTASLGDDGLLGRDAGVEDPCLGRVWLVAGHRGSEGVGQEAGVHLGTVKNEPVDTPGWRDINAARDCVERAASRPRVADGCDSGLRREACGVNIDDVGCA